MSWKFNSKILQRSKNNAVKNGKQINKHSYIMYSVRMANTKYALLYYAFYFLHTYTNYAHDIRFHFSRLFKECRFKRQQEFLPDKF
jgi:hypothetical protein